jgi:fructokinase
MEIQTAARPIVFGEVLFDCFPDGSVVMGGAPLNVAWHLKGFGLNPLLISRLGVDDNGQAVIDRLQEWGLDSSGIQRDPLHPTGRVEITLKNGQPTFSILPGQAYDYIDAQQAVQVVSSQPVALLYHGSLAARNSTSLQALQSLRQQYNSNIFVDINLRAPWWHHDLVNELVTGARWLKLNDVEVIELSPNAREKVEQLARAYAQKFSLERLILTLGDKGACVFENGQVIKGEPVLVTEVADTVGAGDAFSSIMILGGLRGWSATVTMPRALEFAALLCSVRGATLSDPGIYAALLDKWGST